MLFKSDALCRNIDMMRETVAQIAKYSKSDIIITDENFNIAFHNANYASENEIVTLFDVINELLNSNMQAKLKKFKSSGENRLYIKLLLSDTGSLGKVPIDMHLCKIKNSQKKLKGFVVIIQDAAQEIRNKIQKETFIDILTRSLKNPMQADIQMMELVLNNKFGALNDDLKEVLGEILRSFKHIKYTADNLVIKYKNEFDAFELNKKKYSIVKLIKDKCGAAIKILDRKKQTVEMIASGNIPDVMIDTEEMAKVIRNLLISASNESRENSKIIIKINTDNENVYVSLMDCGYSANKEVLDNLFEEYIACSNKFRKIGFSLELFNCRRIIEAHGGAVSAQNCSRSGRTITFSLPVCCG